MIETRSGLLVDPFDLRPEQVRFSDIAFHLSNIGRFNGAVEFYSVAQHSVIMSHVCPRELALECLLHDATEAYVGDVVRPIKHREGMEIYRAAEDALEAIVRQAFGLPGDHHPDEVKVWDDRMLLTEARAFRMRHTATGERWDDVEPIEGIDELLDPWLPVTARAHFIARYRNLTTPEEA